MLSTSKSVCIASCPSTTTVSTYQTTACIPGVTATLTTYAQLVLAGNCSAYNYQATPVLSVCVPDISAITNEMIKASASSNKTTADLSPSSVFNSAVSAPIQVVSDLQKTWPVLAVSAAGALIVAFLWLFLIQWFGSIFIWLVIAAFNVILIAASVWLYFYWQSMIVKANSSALGVENMEVTGAVIAFGIVAAIAFIFLLITLALLKKISLAIQIIKEATQAVRAMPLIGKPPSLCCLVHSKTHNDSFLSPLVLGCNCVFHCILFADPSATSHPKNAHYRPCFEPKLL